MYTVKDVRYGEYFGFTDAEVRHMLEYYEFTCQYDAVKEWYDGYLFGNSRIYCPWDVINYCWRSVGRKRDKAAKLLGKYEQQQYCQEIYRQGGCDDQG